jgi:hypothetical protein
VVPLRLQISLVPSGSSLISARQGAAKLSGQLYAALVQNDTTQAANVGKALPRFAPLLNGKSEASIGRTPITIGLWIVLPTDGDGGHV